jgi:hypothetical protein
VHEIYRRRNMLLPARPIKVRPVKDHPNGARANTGNPRRARTIRLRPTTCR